VLAWLRTSIRSAASILFGNITATDSTAGIDIPATMFAGGTIMVSFTIAIGWFALRPLFDTVGLHQLAQITGGCSSSRRSRATA
jgi:hypothetical protein